MPGIIQSVDLTKLTATVQIAIQGVNFLEDGSQAFVNICPLVHCPIIFPSAGGFILTFPMAAGDEVLIIIASRCIDAWWQNGGFQNPPMEMRMHDLSDGFCLPGPKSVPKALTVTGISSTAVQLRNNAGTTYIEISAAGKATLMSASEIDLTAPTIQITGTVNVTGALTATSVTAGGVSLATHVHNSGAYTAGAVPVTGVSGTPI